MPLVTRQANQGRLFVEDSEPTNIWQDGDIWVDTSEAPPLPYINDDGTARTIRRTIAELITYG